ncbi:tRNA pseudouridine(38-40) synthase TruA [Austwickia sp. TVS 96-490-7B]|uniref:tRNA pseudouridine synthase A n=1 Tax=Austwickia sp. TVS 96-490-7B TaxID=2830843 RepID=UPI001C583D04|nr:tRNA pseudouridine synthase A [Austwickia sp. TVS 96-490-7B]
MSALKDPAADDDSERVRLRIDFSYDGTEYAGWAKQPGLRTIEEELTTAVQCLLRQENLRLTIAGRTDAGVHARGAVAHVDVDPRRFAAVPGRSARSPEEAALARFRGILPPDIVVRRVQRAPAGFDARFSAVFRRYSYRLTDRPSELDPLRRRDTVIVSRPLQDEVLDAEARSLEGFADFAAFCKRRDGATTIRTLLLYRWTREKDGVLRADVQADAFCHSMVRSLVGAVLPAAEGRRPAGWAQQILTAGQRDPGVTVMPAHGLVLEEVGYPADSELAHRAQESRAVRTLP